MIIYSQLGYYGRFANALYQIAGTIGIAIKSGQPFGFPKFINHDHKDRFGSTEEIECYKFFENELPQVIDGIYYNPKFIGWGYHEVILPQDNWDISGHLQSPKFFSHCIDTVRFYMTMKGEVKNDYCAIHYRGGDYIDDPNAYHPRCTKKYYEEAVSRIPESKFLVFSDDKEAAKMVFDFIDYEFSEGDYLEDFKVMKSCKHFICANSSFSAFAATMADQPGKVVVAPKKWFGDVAGINGNDIYESNWIVI